MKNSMKYAASKLQPKVQLCALAFTALCIAAASMTPNAHARNQILKGVIEAERVCHDGANRGASVNAVLGRGYRSVGRIGWSGKVDSHQVEVTNVVFSLGAKSYYHRTTCRNLGDELKPGEVVYPFYDTMSGYSGRCADFTIKYVKNGKEVWIQNGGSTLWNISCVAKDGL